MAGIDDRRHEKPRVVGELISLDAATHAAAGQKLTLKIGLSADFSSKIWSLENLATDEHGWHGFTNNPLRLIFINPHIRVIRGKFLPFIFVLPGYFFPKKSKGQRLLSALPFNFS